MNSTPKRYLLICTVSIISIAAFMLLISLISPIFRNWQSDITKGEQLDVLQDKCSIDVSVTDYQAGIAACESAIALNFSRSEPDQHLHARLLYDLTHNHYWAKNYDLAKTYGLAAIDHLAAEKATDNDDLKKLSKAYNTLGRAYYYGSSSKKDQDMALHNYAESIAILRKMSPVPEDELGSRINNMGAVYYSQSKYQDSYKALLEGLKLREKTSDASGGEVAESAYNLAMTLEAMEMYIEANSYWKRVLHNCDNHLKKDASHDFFEPSSQIDSFVAATEAQLDRPSPQQDLALASIFIAKANFLAKKNKASEKDMSTIDELIGRISDASEESLATKPSTKTKRN